MRASSGTHTPILYGGRFVEDFRRSALQEGCLLLGDWDALPVRLAAAAAGASVIIVGDLLSFPFEALAGEACDVPLVLVLPADRDADFLLKVFGETVFGRLGFFDRVATPDTNVWRTLRQRYGWAESQRVTVEGDTHERVAETLEAVRSVSQRTEKAAHRAEEAVLLPRFAAAQSINADEVPMDVLQVGVGDARWVTGFDLTATRFCGVDEDPKSVALADRNFPEGNFEKLGPEPSIPRDSESFDLAFSTGSLGLYPDHEKRTLLSEMWRVTRPGGRLLFLEDFVSGEEAAPHVTPVNDFVELLMEATSGQAVLEHVESVQYPGEDAVRGGVLMLSRLGVPKRW